MSSFLWAPSRARAVSPGEARPSRGLFREGVWVALGQAAAMAGVLAGIRVITEFVPPSVYGTASLLLGASALVYNLSCGPLLNTLLRFYPELKAVGGSALVRRTFRPRVAGAASIGAALLIAGGAAFSLATGTPYAAYGALAGLFLVDAARGFETNLLSAARRQRAYALWNAADAFARPALAVAAVLVLGAKPQALLAGYLAGSGLVLAAGVAAARRGRSGPEDPPDVALPHALGGEIRRYALPLVPLAIIGWVSSLGDRYVIGGLWGLEQAGLYAAAHALVSRPLLVAGGVIVTTLRPVYFEAVSRGDATRARDVLRLWLSLTAGVALLGFLVVYLLRGPIISLVLSEKYRSVAALLPWIALGYAFLVLSHVFNNVSLACKRSGAALLAELGGTATALLVGIPLTWKFGLIGAAGAVPFAFFVQLVLAWGLCRIAARRAGEARPAAEVAAKETV